MQSWNMHVANQASEDVTHIRDPNKFANKKCSREGYVLYLLFLWGFGVSLQDQDSALCSIYWQQVSKSSPAYIKHRGKSMVFPVSLTIKAFILNAGNNRKTCFTTIKYVSNLLGYKAFLQVFATLF